MNDPYQVLGVSESASDEEIKNTVNWLASTIRIIIMTILWQIWHKKR